MNRTPIEWTDFSSNPWKQRCKKKCWYCYAWKSYPRLGYKDKTIVSEKELSSYGKRKKPSMIFMGSMTDLLGEWVPDDVVNYCIVAAKCYPRHTFQFLTKNPSRYYQFDFPGNCWLGATATDQEQWNEAVDVFAEIHHNVKFISCEPLLENITSNFMFNIDWLIIGGLADMKAGRPYYAARELLKVAKDEKVPVFIKNNMLWPGEKIQEWPEKLEEKP
jgi:protein gp37